METKKHPKRTSKRGIQKDHPKQEVTVSYRLSGNNGGGDRGRKGEGDQWQY